MGVSHSLQSSGLMKTFFFISAHTAKMLALEVELGVRKAGITWVCLLLFAIRCWFLTFHCISEGGGWHETCDVLWCGIMVPKRHSKHGVFWRLKKIELLLERLITCTCGKWEKHSVKKIKFYNFFPSSMNIFLIFVTIRFSHGVYWLKMLRNI